MSEIEVIESFIKQLPKLNEVMRHLKERSEVDVLEKYDLEKHIEMTDETMNMNHDELNEYLEKKYDQLNEIQLKEENENKQRNRCFDKINEGVKIIKTLIELSENINEMKDYDSINMNNVNLLMNRIVDRMYDNENKQHEEKINEMNKLIADENKQHEEKINEINKLRKPVTTNEIEHIRDILKLKSEARKKAMPEAITKQMDTLEQWCGKKYSQVIYNSDVDGKDSSAFRNKILNHKQLYFFVIDDNDNIFGHYTDCTIDKTNTIISNGKEFLFTVYSNGRIAPTKFANKQNNKTGTMIFDSKFYCCYWGYVVYEIEKSNSLYHLDMEKNFDGAKKSIFMGGKKANTFTPKKIIVMEMK